MTKLPSPLVGAALVGGLTVMCQTTVEFVATVLSAGGCAAPLTPPPAPHAARALLRLSRRAATTHLHRGRRSRRHWALLHEHSRTATGRRSKRRSKILERFFLLVER